jgi:hypothetical protein
LRPPSRREAVLKAERCTFTERERLAKAAMTAALEAIEPALA